MNLRGDNNRQRHENVKIKCMHSYLNYLRTFQVLQGFKTKKLFRGWLEPVLENYARYKRLLPSKTAQHSAWTVLLGTWATERLIEE